MLPSENTMLLTPSTSNREFATGIKNYQKQMSNPDNTQSQKKTAKLFDYLDLRNGYNMNNNSPSIGKLTSPKFDNLDMR
jgi:hypothetical protein